MRPYRHTSAAVRAALAVASLGVIHPGGEAPHGEYAQAATAGYVYTDYTVTQTALTDEADPSTVRREVDPGDGTGWQTWEDASSEEASWEPRYIGPGHYRPRIRLTDASGNRRTVRLAPVTVRAEHVAPVLRVTRPVHPARASSWGTVAGTMTDRGGSGADLVLVTLTQRRAATWFAYDGGTRQWVRVADARSTDDVTPVLVTPDATGAWSATVDDLTPGVLRISAAGFDYAGNDARTVVLQQRLRRT